MRPPKKKVDSAFKDACARNIAEGGDFDAIRLEGDNDWPEQTIGTKILQDGESTHLLDFCHEISRKA